MTSIRPAELATTSAKNGYAEGAPIGPAAARRIRRRRASATSASDNIALTLAIRSHGNLPLGKDAARHAEQAVDDAAGAVADTSPMAQQGHSLAPVPADTAQ